MPALDSDAELRLAAITHCAKLVREHQGAVPWAAIQQGLEWHGERVYLGSTPRGIHRPAQMKRGVLSIKTTKPKPGRHARYDDQIRDDGLFVYAFQGSNPDNHDNRCLREAFEDQTPFLYFYGLVPGVYEILAPCYVTSWDAATLQCQIAVGREYSIASTPPSRVAEPIERQYLTVQAKMRLHQSEFRRLVLSAYGERCAISNLPLPKLLDAAHIIPDRDERGRPEVSNGLCLSKLHHTAFDQQLLGISPDGIVHIADSVLAASDGPTLEQGLKAFHHKPIRQPRSTAERPDRDYLAERFEQFLKAG